MDQRNIKILHTDMARVREFCPDDLEYFAKILNDLLRDTPGILSQLNDADSVAETKVGLAVALFKCAIPGERDDEGLKQKAVATFMAERERAEHRTN